MGRKEQGDTRADNFQHISFFDHREWNTLSYMYGYEVLATSSSSVKLLQRSTYRTVSTVLEKEKSLGSLRVFWSKAGSYT